MKKNIKKSLSSMSEEAKQRVMSRVQLTKMNEDGEIVDFSPEEKEKFMKKMFS